MDWGTWVQQQAGGLLDAYTYKKQTEAYTEAMRLQALGETGYYVEGQRGNVAPVSGQSVGGIPTQYLLIGGALLVAVLLVKD